MKMNMNALKALELKLDEYIKVNGSIAEHESANANCSRACTGGCSGACTNTCSGSCKLSCSGNCSHLR